jgi:hypothetical protein
MCKTGTPQGITLSLQQGNFLCSRKVAAVEAISFSCNLGSLLWGMSDGSETVLNKIHQSKQK